MGESKLNLEKYIHEQRIRAMQFSEGNVSKEGASRKRTEIVLHAEAKDPVRISKESRMNTAAAKSGSTLDNETSKTFEPE